VTNGERPSRRRSATTGTHAYPSPALGGAALRWRHLKLSPSSRSVADGSPAGPLPGNRPTRSQQQSRGTRGPRAIHLNGLTRASVSRRRRTPTTFSSARAAIKIAIDRTSCTQDDHFVVMNGVTSARTVMRTAAAWQADVAPATRGCGKLEVATGRRRRCGCPTPPRLASPTPRLPQSLVSRDGSPRRPVVGAAARSRSKAGAASRSGALPPAGSGLGSSHAPLRQACLRSGSPSDASKRLWRQPRSARTGLCCCMSSRAESTTGASTTGISTTWPRPSTPSSTPASDVDLRGDSAVEHLAGVTDDRDRGDVPAAPLAGWAVRRCHVTPSSSSHPATSLRRGPILTAEWSPWRVSDRPTFDAFSGQGRRNCREAAEPFPGLCGTTTR
jgi:hypothetical protein